MRALDIIAKKRDGSALSREEIEFFVNGYTQGAIPDYQAAAWLMAIVCRGMSVPETTDLTRAMVASGRTLEWRSLVPVVADKHSTGGVGDKTTLVVAPLVAAAGLPVAKMSGRGLGFTGGTLDKLESIPGLRVDLGIEQMRAQVASIGIALVGQSQELAPADGKLYALRDVTATVPSIPLIASSIMSKKIAAGADVIVLDVKVGQGAFMKTLDDARALSHLMVQIGRDAGRRVVAVLAGMDQPLGQAVGNALEVLEAVQTLQGQGPADLREHCLLLAAYMLFLGGLASTLEEARLLAEKELASGRALEKLAALVKAQGGDPRVVQHAQAILPQAPLVMSVPSPRQGYLAGLHAEKVGLAVMRLGAGRTHKGDPIDPRVGLVLHKKVSDHIGVGEPLFSVHARDQASCDLAVQELLAACTFSDEPLVQPRLIWEVLTFDV